MTFRRHFSALLVATLSLGAQAKAQAAHLEPPGDAVLVLGSLHALHEREPSFDYATLRSAIATFQPDVVVLEVRPDELDDHKATPGRPEYPAVVWPLLKQMPVEARAMEPGGATFKAITGEVGTILDAFQKRDPAGAASLARLDAAIDESLLAHWSSASRSQDATTDAMIRGFQAMQGALAGPAFAAAQARWDNYMSERAAEAVRTNRGKRVLVLGSYRNRHRLEARLRQIAANRVIDAPSWLARSVR